MINHHIARCSLALINQPSSVIRSHPNFRVFASGVTTEATKTPQARVAVIGAGVMGLAAATRILESLPNLLVHVLSENGIQSTTGAASGTITTSEGAGGLWKPYTLENTPPEKVNTWGQSTLDHYLSLYFSPQAPTSGVLLTSAYQLWKDPIPDPEWSSVVPHFRHLTAKELQLYDRSGIHSHGWFYQTVITEGRVYLQWLRQRILSMGGTLHQTKINSFNELSSYDVVVNCTGLGARQLCNDTAVKPNRGQVLRVKAPWIRHYTNANGECYIIPNSDTVVLGGSLGPDDYDTTPRDSDRQRILEKCIAVMPSLAAAEIVGDWVGLRPSRSSVRLELERILVDLNESDKILPVVHCYGHGGAGLTLGWGCAGEVTELVKQALL